MHILQGLSDQILVSRHQDLTAPTSRASVHVHLHMLHAFSLCTWRSASHAHRISIWAPGFHARDQHYRWSIVIRPNRWHAASALLTDRYRYYGIVWSTSRCCIQVIGHKRVNVCAFKGGRQGTVRCRLGPRSVELIGCHHLRTTVVKSSSTNSRRRAGRGLEVWRWLLGRGEIWRMLSIVNQRHFIVRPICPIHRTPKV